MAAPAPAFPIIDISCLRKVGTASSLPEVFQLSRDIYKALNSWGAFVCVGHKVDEKLQADLVANARKFFDLPLEKKNEIHVTKGGPAWRGYMPQGGEETHGRVDRKEGLYVGSEMPLDHPRVKAGVPLHGRNLFPDDTVPGLRSCVLRYLDQTAELAQTLLELVSLSLGVSPYFIRSSYTYDPILLFRLFNYPPAREPTAWGIGEHTDYGLFTVLKQDSPGLQFEHAQHGWVEVPMIPNSFVCNAGDLLDRLFGGRFRSPKHRAVNLSDKPRLSFPLFFDPAWDAKMVPVSLTHLRPLPPDPARDERWSKTAYVELKGEYSQYLAKKVSKVFNLGDVNFDPARGPSTRFTIALPKAAM